jgi:hypothetical protein
MKVCSAVQKEVEMIQGKKLWNILAVKSSL